MKKNTLLKQRNWFKFFMAGMLLVVLLVNSQLCFAAGETYKVVVEKGYLALRNAKGYDYNNEIGELYTGDIVEVSNKNDDTYWWVYSSKYDTYGFVNKNYLVKIENASSNTREKSTSSGDIDYGNMRVYTSSNGNEFYGYIGENGIEGYGMAYYTDGDYHEGFFRNGKRNGLGVYNFADGDMLIGFDSNNVTEGVGAYIYEDQSVFVGFYEDGKRHGDGILFDTAGETLTIGKWEEGTLSIRYEYDSWSDNAGNISMGMTKNGELNGMGVITEGEDIYIGQFIDGEEEGFGVAVYEDKEWEIGYFDKGRQAGGFVYIDEKGEKMIGCYGDGEYIGNVAVYDKNGEMLVADENLKLIGSIQR